MTYDPRQRQINEEAPPDAWEMVRQRRYARWQRQRQKACYAVQVAIKRGILLTLPHVHVHCVDCGQPATCYDHRDYDKPLDVRAVCQSCNLRRGPAKHAPYFERPDPIEGGERSVDITFPLTVTMCAPCGHSESERKKLTYEWWIDLLTAL